MDPSAYFRTAWLLDTKEMRRRDIVADYYRYPNQPANLALETLMIAANEDMTAARYEQAHAKLAAVNAVLDAVEEDDPQPFSASTLAASYLGTVRALSGEGYTAQRINLQDDTAEAWVTTTTGGESLKSSWVRPTGMDDPHHGHAKPSATVTVRNGNTMQVHCIKHGYPNHKHAQADQQHPRPAIIRIQPAAGFPILVD
jgi:hypothetical protein